MYCAELARTEKQQDECLGDLEDTLALSERDKARGLRGILQSIEVLRLARNPCGFWEKLFRSDRCEVPSGDE